MTTFHAAYEIAEGRHVTIFYNDKCDASTLFNLVEHLKDLPTGRIVKVDSVAELDNPNDSTDPLIGLKLLIMQEDGLTVDTDLLLKIAHFSDRYSWRSNLPIDGQYTFTLHTTLGPKSKVTIDDNLTKQTFRTGSRYIKDHAQKQEALLLKKNSRGLSLGNAVKPLVRSSGTKCLAAIAGRQ